MDFNEIDKTEKARKIEWETAQKKKVKRQWIKNALRNVYMSSVMTLLQHPKYEDKSFEYVCEQAYNLAKQIEMTWLVENPEDGPDNVDEVILNTHIGGGGY